MLRPRLAAIVFCFFTVSANACDVSRIQQKWSLWTEGACLRGANVWQKAVQGTDDKAAIGPGPFGPPYSPEGLLHLAQWGANYVNLSHPGIFTERPPYRLDPRAQKNLDELVDKAEKAGLFVVISFRTGPGRTEKALTSTGQASDHAVWTSAEAQTAWVKMWEAAATRYRNRSVVVGYDLMVEPNSNGALLNIYEPDVFFRDYGRTLYNWYPLAERIATAVRKIDAATPILIGAMNWSSPSWLSTIPAWKIPRVVYVAHHYEPFVYTHQRPPLVNTYPGTFDADYDGKADAVDKGFVRELLQPIRDFRAARNAPVAVNEFGVARWQPGAASFLRDVFDIFEEWGVNSALWLWESDFAGVDWDDFNFRHGGNPAVRSDVPGSDIELAIRAAWKANALRPGQLRGRW